MIKTRLLMGIVVMTLLTALLGACAPQPSLKPPSKEEANFRFLISDDVNAIDDFESVIVTISTIGVQRGGES